MLVPTCHLVLEQLSMIISLKSYGQILYRKLFYMETDFPPNHKLNMIDSFSVHHIAPFIVKGQLSGHSYAVPALCEAVSNNIDTHLHTAGKSNLVFKPSFKVHEYRIDFMLKSSQFGPVDNT